MPRKKLVEMLKKAGYSQKAIENVIEFYTFKTNQRKGRKA
jgi:hypothetical protein